MDELEEIKATFFQECDELLGDLESGLLSMQDGTGDAETVNAVFRAVHSIKGGAGAFGLDPLVRYAHVFETLLDGVRAGKIEALPDLVRTLLRAADVLADQVTAARTGGVSDVGETAAMVAELEVWITGGAPASAPAAPAQDEIGDGFTPLPIAAVAPPAAEDDDFGFKPMAFSLTDLGAPAAPAEKAWLIAFKPAASLYAKANETGLLLRELERLGPLEISVDDSALPDLDSLDPEESYLSWKVRLTTQEDEKAIVEVFEFVDGDCELQVAREDGEADAGPDLAALIASAQASLEPAPEGAPPAAPPISAPSRAASAPAPEPSPAPVAEAAKAAAAPAAPAAAAPAARQGAGEPSAAQSTIRVDPERIDRLIDLVGELVINQAMLAQRVAEHGFAPSSTIAMGLDELEQLTRGIQDSVMAIRAQPVKSVFQRMPRLVREVAGMTGKPARLIMEGENTEVDKT
ncbi:MAG: Hpt domain-containing protein, partial [Caulobacteraceae bacterium]|nr:Hpt domain-containing protein [Caulobacteraceae bacterium]